MAGTWLRLKGLARQSVLINLLEVFMAKAIGKIEVALGTVYWSSKPTDMDKKGCDGIFVERVELRPQKEWSLWLRLKIWTIALFRNL